jgi:ribonuclease Z
LLLLEPSGHAHATLAAQTAPAPNRVAVQPGLPDNLRGVFLGSRMGPRVNLQQFGASTLVEAGGVRLLFDCGRGATIRVAQVGVPVGSVSRLFLIHLHSDHVLQIPDLLLNGWAGGGRVIPLEIWGPQGTREQP